MKTTFKVIMLAAVVSFSMACKKDRSDSGTPEADSKQMQAIVTTTSNNLKNISFTKDPDVDFLLVLKTQQQGVIDLANLELKSGTDSYLKNKAKEILAKNELLITQVVAYLKANPAQANDLKFDAMLLLNKTTPITQADLSGKIDLDFATLMLGLHQAGVDITKLELAYGRRETILAMANKILPQHQAEVQELKAWLIANQNK